MRVMTLDILDYWTRGAGIVALVVLFWAVVVPDGLFSTIVLAAALIGAALATAVLAGYRDGAGVRPSPGGEPRP